MNLFETLKILTETPGPSGREEPISTVIETIWHPFVDSISRDRLGNLTAVKHGQGPTTVENRRPRLLITAHQDEIGLIVAGLDRYPNNDHGSGFLQISRIGGIDLRHLYGAVVQVHGRHQLTGIIGALPAGRLPADRQQKAYDYQDLVVDVGLPYHELKQLVAVGDYITFHQPLRQLQNGRVTGKALDNRASILAVAVCLEYLAGRRHDWDVVAVATVQEETALLGAFTTAFAHRPEAAIALDVTFGKGPSAKDGGLTFEIDEGVTIGFGPNVHPGLYNRLREAANALEMKTAIDPHAKMSGTDAFGLQIAREGVPTGLLGIPLRYMHTPVEVVALADIERTGRLLSEFTARLNATFLDEIAKELLEP